MAMTRGKILMNPLSMIESKNVCRDGYSTLEPLYIQVQRTRKLPALDHYYKMMWTKRRLQIEHIVWQSKHHYGRNWVWTEYFLWNDINIYVWLRRKSMDTYVYITISAFNNSLKDLFSLSKAVHVTNFRNPYILHGKHHHIQLSQMSLQLPDSVWIHQTANNRLPQKAHLKFTLQNENKIRPST